MQTMRKPTAFENNGNATVTLHIRRDQVQVHDDYLTLNLPARPLEIDWTEIRHQLEHEMPVRAACKLIDELGEDLYRRLVEKMLSDLIA